MCTGRFVHICMYTFMCRSMYMKTHTCAYKHSHVYTFTNTCVCVCVCMHIYAQEGKGSENSVQWQELSCSSTTLHSYHSASSQVAKRVFTRKTCGKLASTAPIFAEEFWSYQIRFIHPTNLLSPPQKDVTPLTSPNNLRICFINSLWKSVHHWYAAGKSQTQPLCDMATLCLCCPAVPYYSLHPSHITPTLTSNRLWSAQSPHGNFNLLKIALKKSTNQQEWYLSATRCYLIAMLLDSLQIMIEVITHGYAFFILYFSAPKLSKILG